MPKVSIISSLTNMFPSFHRTYIINLYVKTNILPICARMLIVTKLRKAISETNINNRFVGNIHSKITRFNCLCYYFCYKVCHYMYNILVLIGNSCKLLYYKASYACAIGTIKAVGTKCEIQEHQKPYNRI